MDYKDLKDIDAQNKITITSMFSGLLTGLKHISINKITLIIRCIPDICRLHHNSCENRKLRNSHGKKFHPVKPHRGEIYNAIITEGCNSL